MLCHNVNRLVLVSLHMCVLKASIPEFILSLNRCAMFILMTQSVRWNCETWTKMNLKTLWLPVEWMYDIVYNKKFCPYLIKCFCLVLIYTSESKSPGKYLKEECSSAPTEINLLIWIKKCCSESVFTKKKWIELAYKCFPSVFVRACFCLSSIFARWKRGGGLRKKASSL